MNDAVSVRVGQCVTHMQGDRKCVSRCQRALSAEQILHVGTLNELHHKIEQSFVSLAKVMYMNDAGVIQPRHRARFVFESLSKGV